MTLPPLHVEALQQEEAAVAVLRVPGYIDQVNRVGMAVLCYPCADQTTLFGYCLGDSCSDWRCECRTHDAHGHVHKPGA